MRRGRPGVYAPYIAVLMFRTSKFLRSSEIDQSLQRSISPDRLSNYLQNCGNDLEAAITLYEENTLLSERFYTPLQCLEVCLRNTIHIEMSNTYGCNWINDPIAPLNKNSINAISEVIERFDRDPGDIPAGAVVADSKFSFWVGLLSGSYDASIWRNCLHRGFKKGAGKTRKQIHGRFNAIRRFRNRVMHHEPIIFRDPNRVYDEIVEAVGWMCQDTKRWLEHRSNYVRK